MDKTSRDERRNGSNVAVLVPTDRAYRDALRAAAFLLESYTWTVTRNCRVDLTEATRRRLAEGACELHRRGIALLQQAHVQQYFRISQDDLRQGSVGVARLRGRGEFCDAWSFFKDVQRRAVQRATSQKAAGITVSSRVTVREAEHGALAA